jgi:hypothetical protein
MATDPESFGKDDPMEWSRYHIGFQHQGSDRELLDEVFHRL